MIVENPYKVENDPPGPAPLSPPLISASNFRCIKCGYDLSGAVLGGLCPECGMRVEQSLQTAVIGGRTSQLALWSMIVGIASMTFCTLGGPVAIILAVLARKSMSEGGYSTNSRGFATAGFVLGIIATALGVVTIAIVMLMFAANI